jgi:ABC-2 type transport system permease protein
MGLWADPASSPLRTLLLFQRLRRALLRNTSRVIWRESPIRLLTLLVCSGVVWLGVLGTTLWGLRYVKPWVSLNGEIMELVLSIMFLSLAMLLLFSTAIILYSSLFSSAESTFLLTTPAAADQVFAYKFQGAVAFSSWSFVLLGSPILLGYGIRAEVEWPFYVALPFYFLGFVLLPASLGALACLLVVNFVPKHRKQIIALAVVFLLAVAGFVIYRMIVTARTQAVNREMLNSLLGNFRFAQNRLMPSLWIARGLKRAGRGDIGESAYFLALIWANGLFLYVVVAGLARKLYRRGYNRLTTGGSLRRRYGGGWLDRCLSTLVGFLDPQTRLLIVKDFRTFRRDPAQWAQILIFTALMGLYFINMRRFLPDDMKWPYRNWVSLLNLCATGLLLSAYTGRFIYPMLSLEGRKFWILGLLPLRRERLLWGKFAFSATGGLLIAEFLVLLNDLILELPPIAVVLHAFTVAMLAVGLSGLSVGLGACLPNFRETDPSKIAVGFGGTLNLLAGLVFLLVTIALIAGPWHVAAAQETDAPSGLGEGAWVLGLRVLAGVFLCAGAVAIPLRAGASALRRMEF